MPAWGLCASASGTVSSSYVGIDIAEDAIRAADAMADDSTTFVHGDLVDTDVGEPGSFDVAICEEVLDRASDPPTRCSGGCTSSSVRAGTCSRRACGTGAIWRCSG